MEAGLGTNDTNPGLLRVLQPLQRVENATFTVDFGKQTNWDARLRFAKESDAQAAVPAARDALVIARILRASWQTTIFRSALTVGLRSDQEEKEYMVAALLTEAFERSLRQARVEQQGKDNSGEPVHPNGLAGITSPG